MNRTLKAIAVLMLIMVFAVSCKKPDVPNDDYVTHDYVDLCLPSGTLWATCNVGATTPEGYGDHFAWGETRPGASCNWLTYAILMPSEDAATANWGASWRTPTKEEWQELNDCCTSIWTTQNGVNGRLFTSDNGNSIFLPSAGFLWGDDLMCVGSDGFYWSSSLYTGSSTDAWGFDFDTDRCGVYYSYRDDGRSVRAVRSAK